MSLGSNKIVISLVEVSIDDKSQKLKWFHLWQNLATKEP